MVGGTINQRTRNPGRELGGRFSASVGEFDYKRFFGLIDSPCRFEAGGKVGWGLFEYCFMGPFERYGIDNPLFWNLKL